MNILLITNLYPCNTADYTVSKALHLFVKEWVRTDNVFVIKTKFFPAEIFKMNSIKELGQFEFEKVHGETIPIYKVPKSYRWFNPKIKQILNKYDFNPTVVISHMPVNHFIAYGYAYKMQKPLIVGIHMSEINLLKNANISNKLKREKLKKIYQYSNLIVCRSYAIYNQFIKIFPEFQNKAKVIYSGIEKKIIINKKDFLQKVENIKQKGIINIVTVAKLIELKNINITLMALSKLPSELKWNYMIIGDGNQKENLKKLTVELNISNKVQFLGLVEHSKVFEYLKKSDLFILVSAPETFGLVYLEAMASGCIVIGTKDWGIDGIIINKKNGFLVDPRNVNELYLLLNKMLVSSDECNLIEILHNSYNTIFKYTATQAGMNYLNLIKKVHN